MYIWLCGDCYESLAENCDILTIGSLKGSCNNCHSNKGKYCIDPQSILGREGKVFLDGKGQPMLVKEDRERGSIWFYVWEKEHWMSWERLSEVSYIFDVPANLTNDQQEYYHSLHRQWEDRDKMSLTSEILGKTIFSDYFDTQSTRDLVITEQYESEIYGIWNYEDEGWWINGNDVVFHTFYLNVAKAQFNCLIKTISTIKIAKIGQNGEPVFLEQDNGGG